MPTETVSYIEAIGEALRSEMDADPDVFLIGEDVGQFGGAFKATRGFLDRPGCSPDLAPVSLCSERCGSCLGPSGDGVRAGLGCVVMIGSLTLEYRPTRSLL